MKYRLTHKGITSLTKPGKYGDAQMPTLFMNVAKRGSRSWIQRIVIDGVQREMGLGPYPLVAIEEARSTAFENRRAIYHGKNPFERSARQTSMTFIRAADKFFLQNKARWKPGRASDTWMQSLVKYAIPVFGNKALHAISREDVLRVLTPIWTTKSQTATKLRQKIRQILQWGMGHGYVTMNVAGELIDGALPIMPAAKEHHRALPYQELPEALITIRSCEVSPASKRCLEFLVLTATRSAEAREAEWNESNLEKRTWTIPGQRMKGNVEHRVALSDAALRVLEDAKAADPDSRLIFPSPYGGGALNIATMNKILTKTGLIDRTVVHGFRTSFRTWASECTNTADPIIELALAHKVGSQVQQAYDRSDLLEKRRQLMERWGEFVTGKPAAQVVNLEQYR